jgi:hypothetical protein
VQTVVARSGANGGSNAAADLTNGPAASEAAAVQIVYSVRLATFEPGGRDGEAEERREIGQRAEIFDQRLSFLRVRRYLGYKHAYRDLIDSDWYNGYVPEFWEKLP